MNKENEQPKQEPAKPADVKGGKSVGKKKRKKTEKGKVGIVPYKADHFNTYVFWKALPSFLKNPPADKKGIRLTVAQFCDQLGIEDEDIRELSEITNQTMFAEKYGLDKDTLTKWNKEIALRDPFADIRLWASRLTKNVLLAMYNNSMSSKALNADRDRMNFMKVMGWNEKMTFEAGGGLVELIKSAMERRAKEKAHEEAAEEEEPKAKTNAEPTKSNNG